MVGPSMPQRITAFVKNPHIVLDVKVLADKPEMAALVCQIFASWSSVERELSVLLIRLLGADAAPALAIFSILQTQSLQTKAIEAAARSMMSSSEFRVFSAVLQVVEAVKKTRNKLAHWAWARCEDHPEFILLGDPNSWKQREKRMASHFQTLTPGPVDPLQTWNAIQFDDSSFLAYRKADLEREVRDLTAADRLLLLYGIYLDPSPAVAHLASNTPMTKDYLRKHTMGAMLDIPMFKGALNRDVEKGQAEE
jgi:hypothetical protein